MDFIVVLVTAPGEDEAARIGRQIVSERLAGCVNIVRSVRSIYQWQGKIEDETETLLVIKTRRHLFSRLSDRIKELHSYTVPEVIALPVVEGSAGYLDWLRDVTG